MKIHILQFIESSWWLRAWISDIEYIWNVSQQYIRQMIFNICAYQLCICQWKAYDHVCHIILVLTHDQFNIARDLSIRRTHKLQCRYKPKRCTLIGSNVFATVWYVNDKGVFWLKRDLISIVVYRMHHVIFAL